MRENLVWASIKLAFALIALIPALTLTKYFGVSPWFGVSITIYIYGLFYIKRLIENKVLRPRRIELLLEILCESGQEMELAEIEECLNQKISRQTLWLDL